MIRLDWVLWFQWRKKGFIFILRIFFNRDGAKWRWRSNECIIYANLDWVSAFARWASSDAKAVAEMMADRVLFLSETNVKIAKDVEGFAWLVGWPSGRWAATISLLFDAGVGYICRFEMISMEQTRRFLTLPGKRR